MSNLNHITYQMRRAEIPPPVIEASHRNPVVAEILDAYCRGAILFREEALAQMVVWLSRNWEQERENALRAFALVGTPWRQELP